MMAQRSKKKRVSARIAGPQGTRVEPDRKDSVNWFAVLPILVVTFLLYLPALRFQFVFDDVEQIVKNPNIQSWSYLPGYFTKQLWSQGGWHQARYYRPLFLVWLRMNHALFGFDATYWHLTTIAAHLLATLLVYLLVKMLLKSQATAALSALFFGLHPMHIEVAAWISAASEAILAAALIASLACFANGARRKDWRWVAGSLAFYASALWMKETAIVFPAIIFTFAWIEFDQPVKAGRIRIALMRTMPFLALSAFYLAVRWAVLKGVVAATAPVDLQTLVLTLPSLILFYGRLLVWPAGLSPFYDTPLVTQPGAANFVIPLLVIVAVGIAAALLLRYAWKAANGVESDEAEGRLAILACVWMVVFLLPALYLPGLQNGSFVHDRYLYVPSVGFSILLGLGLSRVGRGGRKIFGMPWAQVSIAVVLAGIMAIGVHAQLGIWANNLTLFTRGAERAPENRIALHDLSAALVDAKRYDDAIVLLQKLLSQNPNDFIDNNNLGQAYLNKGDLEHAEVYLARSCQLHPVARALYQLGAIRLKLGRLEAAEQTLRQAIEMDPKAVGFHYALGVALERENKPAAAIEVYKEELAINPADTRAQNELARLSGAGRLK
jgi:protein O-mannosyl-transferase